MCGIIGYVGSKEATPILLEGLKKLEYRGYDSSGVGVCSAKDGKIAVRKAQGKIRHLEELIKTHAVPHSTIGISHTRWATHGAPCQRNSHPHCNVKQTIAVVHNGIIENYQEIKQELQGKGIKFTSDTDTEVIAHLVSQYFAGDLVKAVQKAIGRVRGAFAIGVISSATPNLLVAARVGSPLIIGIGKGENFIASDVPAILDKTRRVIYLKDGEMAALTVDGVKIWKFDGKPVTPKIDTITFNVGSAQKEGYPHFMLKEVHEQPHVLAQMIKARTKGNNVVLDGIGLSDNQLKSIKNIYIVACGTAYHAGMVGKYIIEKIAGIPVVVDAASEFRYREPILQKGTLVVSVSQSGETADTLAAVRDARARGAKAITICNSVGSSLVRESDGVLYTHAGPEIGVASTKAYTAQLGMFYLLALKLGALHKKTSDAERQKILKEFKHIPELYKTFLKSKDDVAQIAKKKYRFGCFLFLGRNVNYPSAMEGALKLKEISYIPAEGYAAGEMKHGPIALIDEYRAVVCIAPQSEVYEKMISNIQEIRARKGKITAIATQGDNDIKKHADYVIYVPKTSHLLSPLLVALPLQLMAYYIAVNLGCDVDQPRNLAKSVTVE
ncbi:MAG: glutamine--fructose-6-phosphate transaminase (isomerizing) [Candidatus Omnitrophica bacterium]|nr:glutamine--fructose-6-phosphate transaminase (isomerizing) [Candidatus Omnitrophota bacterium]